MRQAKTLVVDAEQTLRAAMFRIFSRHNSKMRTLITFFLVFLATLSIVSPVSAQDMPYDSSIQFSTPLPNQNDFSIQERVRQLVRLAEPGSRVYFNIYLFSYEPLAETLVDALNRGVDIKIVLDRANRKKAAFDILTKGYDNKPGFKSKALCPKKDCLVVCGRHIFFSGACIGTRNNHNKFYLFEQLSDGRSSVVVQSSSNLTGGSSWNDLIEIDGHKGLYQAYLDYWRASYKKLTAPSYAGSFKGPNVEVYFSPQAKGDSILSILNRIDCEQGGKIHLAHSRFTDSRFWVAAKLAHLSRQGCEVSVLIPKNSKRNSPGKKVIHALGDDARVVSLLPTSLHTKFIIIDGTFDSVAQKVVVTGSHNLNNNSLRNNDEALLLVKDQALYGSYLQHWDLMNSTLIDSK